jgi:hypothetical protein
MKTQSGQGTETTVPAATTSNIIPMNAQGQRNAPQKHPAFEVAKVEHVDFPGSYSHAEWHRDPFAPLNRYP